MDSIEQLEQTIGQVAGAAGPSVVGIGARRRGSGFIVGPGKVLTNAHNLRGNEVTVMFADGHNLRGTVCGADLDGDLAVIDVETGEAPALAWGQPEGLAVGSVVFGAAATSAGGLRLTVGTVSALARAFRGPRGRRIAGSIEHTAPLARGSSGGPLLDRQGRVVGLDTSRLGDAFYLARAADAAFQARVASLVRGESVERPRLGIAVAPPWVARRLRRSVGLEERAGLLVREVEEGSPAAVAGIRQGDLVISVAGTPVADPDALLEAIGTASTPFEIGIVRGTEERSVSVTNLEAPTDTAGEEA
ncbi:MAG TPA: trypsin-like peptidase domain-containing protein [Candidatus Limnocylindrales bacterium]|nr:trypsin-like peptidase domain-containing protein [Candidatus Limnocylindrales bacterium]